MAVAVVGTLLVTLGARRVVRVEVGGTSMVPALEPGDAVVAVAGLAARPGQVVAVHDPRDRDRLLVKRVVAVEPGGSLVVAGDNLAASTDSRTFGPVAPALVAGRVMWRYRPRHRRGPVGRAGRWG